MSQELNLYTLRPDGTALYLPELLMQHLGIARGQQLTAEQYEHAEIQGLIGRRLDAEKGKGRRP